MNLKIYLLLLFPLFSLAACSKYPPFEKNDWGELELHGKVKTLKKTKYIYHYNKEEDVLKKIDTLVSIYHFNEKGFLVKKITDKGTSTYSFPKKGVIQRIFIPNDPTEETKNRLHFYNEKGDFTHTKDAITGELKGTTYEYIYDNQNRIIQETSYGTASIELPRERNSYSYDTNGNIETQKIYKWSLFNEEEDGWYLKWMWHHKYNNKRHPTVLETYNAKGENVLNARYEYRYDFNGNYTRKTCYICNVEANKEHLDEIEEREITYY